MVQVLHAHGISHTTIARNIRSTEYPHGIHQRTLTKAFKEELGNAREQVKAGLIASLIKSGLAGNVSAIKYWLGLFGGPEWRMTHLDPDAPNANANGNTTIIIRGGLPPVVISSDADEDEIEGLRAADIKPYGINGANGTHD